MKNLYNIQFASIVGYEMKSIDFHHVAGKLFIVCFNIYFVQL